MYILYKRSYKVAVHLKIKITFCFVLHFDIEVLDDDTCREFSGSITQQSGLSMSVSESSIAFFPDNGCNELCVGCILCKCCIKLVVLPACFKDLVHNLQRADMLLSLEK